MTWKNRALLIGAIVGAVTGLGAALLYIRSVEDTGSDEPHKVKTSDAIMLSVSLANIIRQAAKLAG
jgi:hypothetical protein